MIAVTSDAECSLLIDGQWIGTAATMPILNPYSGAVIDHVACAGPNHARQAIASAERGHIAIARLSTWERAEILRRTAEMLSQSAEIFAATITTETGKPITASRKEVTRAVNTLTLSAEECTRLNGETIAFDSFPGGEQRSGYYIYEPVGIIAAITPFNDPLNLICHKLGPALAAGNSVILKPAEQAPLVAVMLGKLLLKAGLPAGALNILTGYGEQFGDALVADSRIAMVSFTGSAKVGEHITKQAGIKKLAMELGANSPVIVMDDADIDQAAKACASGAFSAAGQNCIGVQRIYVADAVYSQFREGLIAYVDQLVTGDPMDGQTDVGPMISINEAERMEQWTAQAVQAGAHILSGGKREGAIFQPTVLENVPATAAMVCHEVFGPVVSLFAMRDIDQVIAASNAEDYTIHAAIFTRNITTALNTARRLKVAGVMINDSTDYRLDAMPFGGANRGNMGREGVKYAMREMSHTKVICFNMA